MNISIVRDSLVESQEAFFFVVSANQTDDAVQVGSPERAIVLILDEEDGKIFCPSFECVIKCPSLPPVLTAVVDQTAYEVEETAGFLPVCVNISGAALARPVNVQVVTICGSAMGTFPLVLSVFMKGG